MTRRNRQTQGCERDVPHDGPALDARPVALLVGPADPGVARTRRPGRCAPAHQRQPTALKFGHIPEVPGHFRDLLPIMTGADQGVPAGC
jgi:hypothetical protein